MSNNPTATGPPTPDLRSAPWIRAEDLPLELRTLVIQHLSSSAAPAPSAPLDLLFRYQPYPIFHSSYRPPYSRPLTDGSLSQATSFPTRAPTGSTFDLFRKLHRFGGNPPARRLPAVQFTRDGAMTSRLLQRLRHHLSSSTSGDFQRRWASSNWHREWDKTLLEGHSEFAGTAKWFISDGARFNDFLHEPANFLPVIAPHLTETVFRLAPNVDSGTGDLALVQTLNANGVAGLQEKRTIASVEDKPKFHPERQKEFSRWSEVLLPSGDMGFVIELQDRTWLSPREITTTETHVLLQVNDQFYANNCRWVILLGFAGATLFHLESPTVVGVSEFIPNQAARAGSFTLAAAIIALALPPLPDEAPNSSVPTKEELEIAFTESETYDRGNDGTPHSTEDVVMGGGAAASGSGNPALFPSQFVGHQPRGFDQASPFDPLPKPHSDASPSPSSSGNPPLQVPPQEVPTQFPSKYLPLCPLGSPDLDAFLGKNRPEKLTFRVAPQLFRTLDIPPHRPADRPTVQAILTQLATATFFPMSAVGDHPHMTPVTPVRKQITLPDSPPESLDGSPGRQTTSDISYAQRVLDQPELPPTPGSISGSVAAVISSYLACGIGSDTFIANLEGVSIVIKVGHDELALQTHDKASRELGRTGDGFVRSLGLYRAHQDEESSSIDSPSLFILIMEYGGPSLELSHFDLADMTLIDCRNLLDTLKVAHQKGIRHNDIATRNMVRRDGERQIHLVDWGRASFNQSEESTHEEYLDTVHKMGLDPNDGTWL